MTTGHLPCRDIVWVSPHHRFYCALKKSMLFTLVSSENIFWWYINYELPSFKNKKKIEYYLGKSDIFVLNDINEIKSYFGFSLTLLKHIFSINSYIMTCRCAHSYYGTFNSSYISLLNICIVLGFRSIVYASFAYSPPPPPQCCLTGLSKACKVVCKTDYGCMCQKDPLESFGKRIALCPGSRFLSFADMPINVAK